MINYSANQSNMPLRHSEIVTLTIFQRSVSHCNCCQICAEGGLKPSSGFHVHQIVTIQLQMYFTDQVVDSLHLSSLLALWPGFNRGRFGFLSSKAKGDQSGAGFVLKGIHR